MEVEIFDYGMNGEGVAKLDGKILLVENALIDEKVNVEIVSDFKNFSTCKAVDFLTESKERVLR